MNLYEVEPTGSGTRIRHALEVSGAIAGAMKRMGVDRLYRRQLDVEVARVIAMAKSAGSSPTLARGDVPRGGNP